MKTLLVLMLLTIPQMATSRSLHERIRRVAGNYHESELDTNTDEYEYGDDYYDYYDASDYETGSMFSCFVGGDEVALTLMCDGIEDCDDGSDEVYANCEEHGVTTTTTTASTTTTTTAAPEVDLVDDYSDYADACTEEEFQCVTDLSICLPKSHVCDGIVDCPGKEDEANCGDRELKSVLDPIVPPITQNLPEGSDYADGLRASTSKDIPFYDETEDHHLFYDNRNGAPIATPELANSDGSNKVNLKPQIVILPPEIPRLESEPVFIQENEAENDNLNLEADYDYIILDKDGNLQYAATGGIQDDVEEEIPTENDSPDLALNSQEDVGHDDVNMHNDVIRHDDVTNDDTSLSSLEDPSEILAHITAIAQASKSKKKLAKHKKKLRMIMSELLQQVGKIIETDDVDSTSSNLGGLQNDIGINLGLNIGASNDLYSRILSSKPRLRISLDLQL